MILESSILLLCADLAQRLHMPFVIRVGAPPAPLTRIEPSRGIFRGIAQEMSGVSYKNAIKCLNTLQTNYGAIQEIHKQRALGKAPRDPEQIREMNEWVRRIGYSPVEFNRMRPIHVTGTKGKGSVCAFVRSILLQHKKAGKVGLYSSPHLKSVRERIMIDNSPIHEEKFAKYFFDVYERLDNTSSDPSRFPRLLTSVKPMYFRFLTLVSFHAFMEENVDNAIYEVGMGGEYDATNIIVQPTACAITSLGLDHTAVLGNTVEQIAWNKSGIFKPGAPAYTIDDQPAEAMKVLRERAAEKKVSKFEVVSVHPQIKGLTMGLSGKFQEKNATLACYLAAEGLGITIDNSKPLPDTFIAGLLNTSLPGRCQVLEKPNAKWFIDGAHTAESLDVAAEWFAQTVDKTKPITLVFNQQKRDNAEELLLCLHRALAKFDIHPTKACFSTNQSFDKGFQDDMISFNVSKDAVDQLTVQRKLAEVWQKLVPSADVQVFSSLEQVVKQADGQVFATGSLLMIGGLLAVID